MHTRFSIKDFRAFTLVETLVAIAILMISVSGPLAVANKALTASLYAKDQSTASFLAQEEMEIIKNLKDNNGGTPNWLGSSGGLSDCIVSSPANAHCDVSINTSGPSLQPSFDYSCNNGGCPLYSGSNGYDHISNGVKTIFSRSFSLTSPTTNSCSVGGSECQATVVVSWYEGTVQNAVTLSSELLNVAP